MNRTKFVNCVLVPLLKYRAKNILINGFLGTHLSTIVIHVHVRSYADQKPLIWEDGIYRMRLLIMEH